MRIQRHVSFKSSSSFVIIFVVMVFLAALDFWILVALRWWNEQGESVSQSLARLNKKDSWLFWWTLFLNVHAAAWVIIGIFSVKRFEADYVLVVAVCASLGIANIVGFTKCRKASAGDQISTESKYHSVLTSRVVLKFMLIGKIVTYYCDHQNRERHFS
ncbi:hypothetical protein POPTR_014G116900v4 [Populus trichocarpa]|uniref:Uncharacterized protein n=5 Tax=Populus trichocarpa TaxID=3694 RepID=A0ACC0RZ51_POPTR|nr:hypothetical protein POPTR_014G116900v4 [Populus trichocarpa]KAI9382306.1 hypothetical protein POPTR_014G116900v4 [Populus trichocarpa]KAI9382307.1 hypothetical protein POPTR_014G116900v4 [Populus trichocarpa]KAI9382308.1 hypothetical protein POPTR_014G116900v4 [Populus trichocarpa]RQP00057.1 hypothetical protein POPTR_014G116900v4 [Populus trichocarpa]|eukprot:XP_024440707.1 Golgi apparatus membrane protein-like protein ECHIDNA isoform X1 [Populus trichocarpa]